MQPTIDNSRVARCQHIKADGIQCNTPAMKHQRFCYYHSQLERTFRKPHRPPQVIGVDTVAAIRLALSDVLNRILRGAIDHRDARLMLRGLQNATVLLKQASAQSSEDHGRVITDLKTLAKHVNPSADREGHGERADGQPSLGQVLMHALENRAKVRTRVEAEERALAAERFKLTTLPPSPYTMLPDDYDDEPEQLLPPPPPSEPDEPAPPPPVELPTDGSPVVCRLVDHDSCEYAQYDVGSAWTCPVNKAIDRQIPYTLPDLRLYLRDTSSCVCLNEFARNDLAAGRLLPSEPALDAAP